MNSGWERLFGDEGYVKVGAVLVPDSGRDHLDLVAR